GDRSGAAHCRHRDAGARRPNISRYSSGVGDHASVTDLMGLADRTHEPPGSNEHPIGKTHRQHGKSTRRGTGDDSSAVLWVVLRSMTRAEERFRIRLPHRHRARLVRANGRVRHDAIRRIFLGVRAELRWFETHKRYLIEKRSVPDHFAFWIHRVRQLLRPSERKVLGLHDLSCSVTDREDESITLLRTSKFWIVSSGDRNAWKQQTESERCL